MSGLPSASVSLRAVGLAVVSALLAVPQPASAHPLGNFTINRYSRLEPTGDQLRITYVLDMAEIPAFQELPAVDRDGDGRVSEAEREEYAGRKAEELRRGLALTLDGRPATLRVASRELSFPEGQAGLSLLRLQVVFESPTPAGVVLSAEYRDENYSGRIGWKEIVVRAGAGASLLESDAPTADQSDELRNYPEDMLSSPPDRTSARFRFHIASGGQASEVRAPVAREVLAGPAQAFTSLVTQGELNFGGVLLAVLASALLGGIHAASPGHGKTVMAAYLVGTHGSFVHALALALGVTVSHTAGVLALGAITLFASKVILPEQLYPWLTLVSGVIVLIIGFGLLLRALLRRRQENDRSDDHHYGFGHQHGHGHAHNHSLPITGRNLVALGLAGGIVPSASALVVLLSALAWGRPGFGLLLVVAFGAGMALVLTTTGFLVVHAGRLIVKSLPVGGSPLQQTLGRAMPSLSALVMTLAGAMVTLQALGQFGLFSS